MRIRLPVRPIRTLLLLALVAAGCESVQAPLAPELPEPALGVANGRGAYQQMAGSIPRFDLQAVIGPEGGTLGAEGFTLSVPRGAVRQPTRFTFRSSDSGFVAVHLSATAVGSTQHNDVGGAGFPIPLSLALRYEPAGGMPAWSRLVVAWVRPDGTLEPVPSGFNPVQRVIVGKVSHFSQYTLAGN